MELNVSGAVAGQPLTVAPGARLAGEASWDVDHRPRLVEVRLFWFTAGKGTRDVGVVETVRFDEPQERERRPFAVTVPAGPYSYAGTLVSVAWALELVLEPGDLVERLELVVKPLVSD
jgi:hypothetical protein